MADLKEGTKLVIRERGNAYMRQGDVFAFLTKSGVVDSDTEFVVRALFPVWRPAGRHKVVTTFEAKDWGRFSIDEIETAIRSGYYELVDRLCCAGCGNIIPGEPLHYPALGADDYCHDCHEAIVRANAGQGTEAGKQR